MKLCTDDADPYVLRCSNCKRHVHYKCAALPLYQLQLFINTTNCTYICRSCVTITEDLTDILQEDELETQRRKISCLEKDVLRMKETIAAYKDETESSKRKREDIDSDREHQLKKELHNARQEVSNLSGLIQGKDDIFNKLKKKTTAKIKDLEIKATGYEKQISKLQEDNKNLITENINTISKCKKDIREKDKNIELLKETNVNLTEVLQEKEASLDEALQREANNVNKTIELSEQVKILENERAAADAHTAFLTEEVERYRSNGDQPPTINPSPELIAAIDNIMTRKMKDVHEKIEAVDKRLDEKLNNNQTQLNKSFADAVSKNMNEKVIENAITTAKNDERLQQNEWNKREKNIIIYGAQETETEPDDVFLQNFLRIVGADVIPDSITRLGRILDGKIRPLKLVMKSTDDKEKIMLRLINLKDADDRYKKVSVRDDYSLEERNLIKQWSDKAASKNAEENTDEYKVRGNPKNGLRLVRVAKRSTTA